MKRFIEGECRTQALLFRDRLDDWIGEDNPVRAAYSGRFVRIRLASIGTNRVAARLNASAVSCGTP